jgi:TonB-dependent starch-binding outer membrane protein SusC
MKKSLFTILLYLTVFSPIITLATNSFENNDENTQPITQTDSIAHGHSNPVKLISGSDYALAESEIASLLSKDLFSGMEGAIPGMDVSSVGAEPGAYVRMLIRGIGSVNGGNDPLIVIDGIPFDNSSLNSGGYRFSGMGELDAEDFQSVTVLKGASSTALYGARGANGVILLTTKQGSTQGNRTHVSYRQGMSSSPNRMELLNADQYMDVLNRAYKIPIPASTDPAPVLMHTWNGFYAKGTPDGSGVEHQPNLSSTNWYENMHMQGTNHHVRASFSGGDNNTRYFVGGTYRHDESYMYMVVRTTVAISDSTLLTRPTKG